LAGGVGQVQITYNADGSTTLLDALGAQRQETFVTIQDVVRRTSVTQGGATARLSHDSRGNVVSYRDFNGHLSCYEYDTVRNLETRRTEGLSGASCPGTAVAGVTRTISTEWHANWRLPRRIAEPLRLTTYAFHGDAGVSCAPPGAATALVCRRTVQATTDADGSQGFAATLSGTPRVWAFTYNAQGQVLSVDGPRSDAADTTTYAYHTTTTADFRAGDLQSITNALGQVTRFIRYDAHGRVRSLIDPNGVVNDFTYDARGRLATHTGGARTTRFDHDPAGQLRRITLPDGSHVHYTYDSARRLVEIADNLGNRRIFTRDDAGNVTRDETRNADGSSARLATRVFDTLGRLLQQLGAAGQSSVFGHDALGNLTSLQDPRHSAANPIVTALAYDALGRLSRITDPHPPGGLTQFGHDGLGQLTRVVAPNNATTTYTLDGLGNLTREVSPDRGTTNFTFDAAGNVRSRTDARGITATYTYDALDRLSGITYPGAGENVSFTWDSAAGSPACTHGIGRLCQASDAGGSTRYAYDARGNVVQTVRTELGVAYTTTFAYDAADRLATLTTPTGLVLDLERDALGRVQRISGTVAGVPTVFVQQVAYTAEGQVRSRTLGNGVVQTTGFDADGRPSTGATSGAGPGTGTPGGAAYRSAEDDIPLPPWALALLGSALLLALLRQAQRRPQRAQRLMVWLVLATLGLSWTLTPVTAYAFDTQRQYDAAGNLVSRTCPVGRSLALTAARRTSQSMPPATCASHRRARYHLPLPRPRGAHAAAPATAARRRARWYRRRPSRGRVALPALRACGLDLGVDLVHRHRLDARRCDPIGDRQQRVGSLLALQRVVEQPLQRLRRQQPRVARGVDRRLGQLDLDRGHRQAPARAGTGHHPCGGL
jgi:YD repeat-containing protein